MTTIHKFSLEGPTRTLLGVILTNDQGTTITFERPFAGQAFLSFDTANVKNPDRFIASAVLRRDVDGEFHAVLIDGERTEFMRENGVETQRIFVLLSNGHHNPPVITDKATIAVQALDGQPQLIPAGMLGFEAVDVPNEFKYTNDPFLNLLFKHIGMPYDYNRQLNNTLLKRISKADPNSDWGFYVYPDGRILPKDSQAARTYARYVSRTLVAKCRQKSGI